MKNRLLIALLFICSFCNAQWDNQQPIFGRNWETNHFEHIFVMAENPQLYDGDFPGDVYAMSYMYSIPKNLFILPHNQITGLSTVASSGNYSDLNGKPLIPTNNNQLTNGSNYLTSEIDGSLTNELQNLVLAGNNLSISNGNSVSLPVYNNYTAGNGISITGTPPNLTISLVQPTITVVTSKVLNSIYTISTTKSAIVSYSVTCTVTNPLLVGTSTAMAYLEYSLNGGTTWLLPSQNGNSSGVGVAVAVALTNTQTANLSAVIPANALVRIRTSTTGSASVAYVTGTEITY